MKFKLTSLEKKWILYDVANSAFTLLVSTIMPIYFNYLAGNAGLSDVDYLAYWGYAASISTLLVALVLFTPVGKAFRVVMLPWYMYLIGLGLVLVPFVVMELSKMLGLIKHHSHK